MGQKELLIGEEKDVKRVNETKGRREGKELRMGKGRTGKNPKEGGGWNCFCCRLRF